MAFVEKVTAQFQKNEGNKTALQYANTPYSRFEHEDDVTHFSLFTFHLSLVTSAYALCCFKL